MSTALSSRVLVVCLAIERNKSTTNLLTAVVVKNVKRIGLSILNIVNSLCYFPNISLFDKFGIYYPIKAVVNVFPQEGSMLWKKKKKKV